MLRLVFRGISRRPGLAFSTIAMLALGIGANAAIYSVVRHLILKPAPVDDPDRLVWVWKTRENLGFSITPSWDEIQDLRKATQIGDLQAFTSSELVLMDRGAPEFVTATLVLPDFFAAFGGIPERGRTFLDEDSRAGNSPVIVSHRFWKSHLGGADLDGRRLSLSGKEYEIVGVMSEGFRFPRQGADLWIPLVVDPAQPPSGLNVLGTLAPGATVEQAKAELDGILAGRADVEGPLWTAQLYTLGQMLGTRTERALWLLFAAVGLVLLIACANAANLIFVQGQRREGELAIRSALGARRGRLIGAVLLESVVLGVSGGIGGLILAEIGLGLMRGIRPPNLLSLESVRLDAWVLVFAFVLACLTGLLAGLLPAIRLSRPKIAQVLRSSVTTSARRQAFRKVVVAFEMALCTVLLAGAALLVRNFDQLRSSDPGYRPEGILTVQISLPKDRYAALEQRKDFFDRLLEHLRAQPDIQEAAPSLGLPSSMGVTGGRLEVEGEGPVESPQTLAANFVGPGYFELTRMTMIAGEGFEGPTPSGESRIVVNRAFAERYFPAESGLGRRIRFGPDDTWSTIVGVVENIKAYGLLDQGKRLATFHPFSEFSQRGGTILLRSRGDLALVASKVPGWIASMDDRLPVREIATAEELLLRSISSERFSTVLFALFASTGVALAGLGLYGVISFSVLERTREFGIRMALGAQGRQILAMVLRRGVVLSGIGLAVGLVGSYWFNKLVASQLVDLSTLDPLTMAVTAAALLLVGLAAAYIPARRAVRVDPTRALKCE